MKLLLDENLSRRMVPLIASHYPGFSQVALLGLERGSDTAIWAYARQHDFIIVTKDSDFVDLSTLYGQPPKIILLKTGNQTWQMTAQALIDRRELLESALIVGRKEGESVIKTLFYSRSASILKGLLHSSFAAGRP